MSEDIGFGNSGDGDATVGGNGGTFGIRLRLRWNLRADTRPHQGFRGVEEEVLRVPADGVESQDDTHRGSPRFHHAVHRGVDGGGVLGFDQDAAAVIGGDTAVGHVSLGAASHHVGGNDGVDRGGGAPAEHAAAAGGNHAGVQGQYGGRLQCLHGYIAEGGQTAEGGYIAPIDEGFHVAAHVVSHHQPTKGRGVGSADIEAQARDVVPGIKAADRLPAGGVPEVLFSQIDARFIGAHELVGLGSVAGELLPPDAVGKVLAVQIHRSGHIFTVHVLVHVAGGTAAQTELQLHPLPRADSVGFFKGGVVNRVYKHHVFGGKVTDPGTVGEIDSQDVVHRANEQADTGVTGSRRDGGELAVRGY